MTCHNVILRLEVSCVNLFFGQNPNKYLCVPLTFRYFAVILIIELLCYIKIFVFNTEKYDACP